MKGRYRALASSVAGAVLTLGLLGVSSTASGASPGRSVLGGDGNFRRTAGFAPDLHLPALRRRQLREQQHHVPATLDVAAALLVRPQQ